MAQPTVVAMLPSRLLGRSGGHSRVSGGRRRAPCRVGEERWLLECGAPRAAYCDGTQGNVARGVGEGEGEAAV